MKRIDESREPVVDRALRLLVAVLEDGGAAPLAGQAARLGIPLSTAYRLADQLVRHGLAAHGRRGHLVPGLRLAAAATPATLADAARPPMRRLARYLGVTAHLGIFEGDMVTYIVKQHGGGPNLFTVEGSQLEAYCSGLGKMLLATGEAARLDAYLAAGPFVPLTRYTRIDPAAIRRDIERTRKRDFAEDDREAAEDLFCLAVPVRGPGGTVVAAVSVSARTPWSDRNAVLHQLRACAQQVGARIGAGPA